MMMNKQQLNELRVIDIKISHKESQLQELEMQLTQAAGVDYGRERIQTTPMPDRLSNDIIRLVELKDQILTEKIAYIQTKENLMREIHLLDDPRYMELLVKRYIEGKTWNAIADDMNYSLRQVHNLHREALESLKNIG